MNSIIGLIILVLDIIAILNIVKSAESTGKKALWIVLVLLLPVIGLVLYFLLAKKASK
jgi:hypothetical protein